MSTPAAAGHVLPANATLTPAAAIDSLLLGLGGASPQTVTVAQQAMRIFFAAQEDQLYNDCYLNQEHLLACHEIVPQHLLAQPVDQELLADAVHLTAPPFHTIATYLLNTLQTHIDPTGEHILAREAYILRVLRDARRIMDALLATACSPDSKVQSARATLTIGYPPLVPCITPQIEEEFGARASSFLITSLPISVRSVLDLPLFLVVKILSLVCLSTSQRDLQAVVHALPHWAAATARITSVTLRTNPSRRNAEAWDLEHSLPNLYQLSLDNPLANSAAPRATSLRLSLLIINMHRRARWDKEVTEATLAALGDARIPKIIFNNTCQLVLPRYFGNVRDQPEHVSLSTSAGRLCASVRLASGRIREFFDLDGGAQFVLSRQMLTVVRSLALSDVLPASMSLNALFNRPAPELETLEITVDAADAAPPHRRLLAYRGQGWVACPQLSHLKIVATQPCLVRAMDVIAFMQAICGRRLEVEYDGVVVA